MLRSPKFVWATCLAAFALTMFLVVYTTTQTMSIQLRFNITPANTITPATNEKKEEKYLTFLPHSGLHNQRIAIINAMILAKSLNRTLILPDMNIGRGVGWVPDEVTSSRISECTSIEKRRKIRHCHLYNGYVPVSVETIFDLSAAHAVGIRTIQRSSMSESYFNDVFGAKEEDIYRVEDKTRTSYRIYDSKENRDPIRQFRYRLELNDLQQRDEKFMLFGSLHYTLRLALQDPNLVWLSKYLREEMSISHPVVTKQALSVLPLLGGPENFVGVHLRQGDGFFVDLMQETLNTLRATLELSTLEPGLVVTPTTVQDTPSQANIITKPLTVEDEVKLKTLKEIDEGNPIDKMPLLNQCLKWHREDNHPRLRLIYMATDTSLPRTTLKELYDEFPCIFSLSDFPGVIESALTMSPMLTGNEELDAEATRLGTTIAPLLIPMIDAEIASHGSSFIGTKRSTFSQYINHRYTRFQNLYHTASS